MSLQTLARFFHCRRKDLINYPQLLWDKNIVDYIDYQTQDGRVRATILFIQKTKIVEFAGMLRPTKKKNNTNEQL